MSLFPASEPDPAAHERAQDLLRDVFGYAQFRGQQQAIIEHVIDGGDALVLMPTGGGKSLCYQIPALVRPGVGIVVSPLIALMKDQVDALRQAGVRAAYLNSSLSPGEARQIEEDMRSGALDLVYVAPERLVMPYFLDLLERLRIALFAIDEAHCVSQWGHNFRPEYRALTILHERFPTVPRIALTATADGPTRKDIVERLQLDEARVFVSGFDRPNIAYRVVEKKDARNQLLHFLRTEHPDDAGIVYCLSRRKVDEVADFLSQHGRLALPYHAGLDAETRQRHQDRFLKDEGVVVVATVAFGMGIDKPNVRFVAHLDVPRSLEAYYQETGRAGRDGLPATAWMTYGLADVISCKQMVQGSELDDRQKRVELQKLDALLGYCETATCRRQVLLNYFSDNSLTGPCGNCDICLNPVKRWDGTIAAQKALSAVYRTGQRFGVQHLVDVLTGKETEKILERGHHLLKTFGVGREIGRNAWQAIFRQLVAGGYLAVDVEGHGGLLFGPKAAAVVKGEDTVEFREHREEKAPRRATGGRRGGTAHELEGSDARLFEALRHWRLELSREQGVPPYVILHDATLVALSVERPADMTALAAIPGVGRSKLDRYGQAILEIVANG
ncbi:ATP-dependent DNA helicase RecQ [Aliidongia dinghuensis]|uniref:DNA helicase RecQ n=1 Tax=Aliidongia dinghuensis TaxID=1867774 RepID=A0A8J3E4B6_9PROT|nr:DNA helicase RecQ [Aliidongia dinghuensis]GGF25716.1 ATP-dependent DNA helicase RecQ [Aliidongia dinghuensis]